jgi:predicted nucleotidyltransferase
VNPYLKRKLPELQTLCRRHGVARLALFGSATRESFDADNSDYDFTVEFLPLPAGTKADAYFDLLEDLQQLLQRPVDLIVNGAITNPFFEESVKTSEQQLYAA